MAPPRIRKTFSGFTLGLQIHLKRPCSIEKELRTIRNRGEFPVPTFTPEGVKIQTTQDKDRVLTQVDRELEDMLKAIRRNEEKYKKEQEEAKSRDQQLRLTRQRQQTVQISTSST